MPTNFCLLPLAQMSKVFELHVSTMGNQVYATQMIELLDPQGQIFAGRVTARGPQVPGEAAHTATDPLSVTNPGPDSGCCKDLEGVAGGAAFTLIVDDSAKVWPGHQENLVVLERYLYFPSSRLHFCLSGPSLLEAGRDEISHTGMLATVAQVRFA